MVEVIELVLTCVPPLQTVLTQGCMHSKHCLYESRCWHADSEGRVRLGPLSGGVRSVTATLQQDSNTPGAVVQRQWDLPWTEPQAPDSLQIAAESTEQVLRRSG